MMANGFKINECDKCVYVKETKIGNVILCLYVDDILLACGTCHLSPGYKISAKGINVNQKVSHSLI